MIYFLDPNIKVIMGNTLPSLSSTCLPFPQNEETLKGLTKNGVIYIPGEGIMRGVKLPANWGIYRSHNRGDKFNGYLINDKGEKVANIYWRRKGKEGNENEANISLASNDKRLNLNVVMFKDGWYSYSTIKQKEYCNLANKYLIAQHTGETQNKLDDMYQVIQEYLQKNPEVVLDTTIPRLSEQTNLVDGDSTVKFVKVYECSTPPNVWVE